MKNSDRDRISSHPVFNSLPANDLVVLLQGAIVQDLPADAIWKPP